MNALAALTAVLGEPTDHASLPDASSRWTWRNRDRSYVELKRWPDGVRITIEPAGRGTDRCDIWLNEDAPVIDVYSRACQGCRIRGIWDFSAPLESVVAGIAKIFPPV